MAESLTTAKIGLGADGVMLPYATLCKPPFMHVSVTLWLLGRAAAAVGDRVTSMHSERELGDLFPF